MINAKGFFKITGWVFAVIGSVHFVRLFTGWTVVLAGYTIPVWVSFFGFIIAWYLAYNAFVLSGKIKGKK